MAKTEYQPIIDYEASKQKFLDLSDDQKEDPKTLYERIADVLATRLGVDWEEVDELVLATKSGRIVVAGHDSEEFLGKPGYDANWIVTTGNFAIRHWTRNRRKRPYELVEEIDKEDGHSLSLVKNPQQPIRILIETLADAHTHTPVNKRLLNLGAS